jgi:hypothetical protein
MYWSGHHMGFHLMLAFSEFARIGTEDYAWDIFSHL